MTIERLNQYRHLVREIKHLDIQLKNFSKPSLRDSVMSSDGPGYSLHEISIYGESGGKQILKQQYKCRKKKAEKERDIIESYIDKIGDSYIRQIVTLRYVEGLNWQYVADRVGGSEDSVRKACKRFVERV